MTALPQKADIRSSKTISALGHKRAQIFMPALLPKPDILSARLNVRLLEIGASGDNTGTKIG
jgi:hypothetical protein